MNSPESSSSAARTTGPGLVAHRERRRCGSGNNLAAVLRGEGETIDVLMVAILAGVSVLIEDVRGVGKTTLAKALARSIDAAFQRVQFTPDLLPNAILGSSRVSDGKSLVHWKSNYNYIRKILKGEPTTTTIDETLEREGDRYTVDFVDWFQQYFDGGHRQPWVCRLVDSSALGVASSARDQQVLQQTGKPTAGKARQAASGPPASHLSNACSLAKKPPLQNRFRERLPSRPNSPGGAHGTSEVVRCATSISSVASSSIRAVTWCIQPSSTRSRERSRTTSTSACGTCSAVKTRARISRTSRPPIGKRSSKFSETPSPACRPIGNSQLTLRPGDVPAGKTGARESSRDAAGDSLDNSE